MPKFLYARPPADLVEERKVRRLAGARHAPGDWILRARMIEVSVTGSVGPTPAMIDIRPGPTPGGEPTTDRGT